MHGQLNPLLIEIVTGFARILEPRPLRNVWQWAEAERILSKGVSSASKRSPIRYRTSLSPHQAKPQESFTDPDVQVTVLIGASQVMGKTEMINNAIGYHMDHEPTNTVVMYPTVESTERYSKRKFAPMARDTPCLSTLLSPARTRDSGNTILVKEFLGGSIFFVGANSAASLRQSSGEVLIADEIDSMIDTDEGDPIELLWKRAESYEDAVKIVSSTPTSTGNSRIWDWFDRSDKQYWFCPCTKCGHYQPLWWRNVQWVSKPAHDPRTAHLICEGCAAELTDKDRLDMYYAGEWRPTAPFTGIRGFHLNGIYCPWPAHKGFDNRLHESVSEFLRIKGDKEKLRVWTNTFLAETFEEESEKPPAPSEIQNRCETYAADPVPAGVLAITSMTDVQDDRLETLVVGWGADEESWGLGMFRLLGNPELPEVWQQQADIMATRFRHPNGQVMTINCGLIDSGHKPKHVYNFCRKIAPMRVYPTKGSSTPEAPLRSLPRKTTVMGVTLVMIGTNTAKDHVFSRIKIDKPGPRYMHFPIGLGFDDEFFEQLCAERRVNRMVKGRQMGEYIKTRARNEAIDLVVGNLVAVDILRPNWELLGKRLAKAEVPTDKGGGGSAPPRQARGGFVNSWRK